MCFVSWAAMWLAAGVLTLTLAVTSIRDHRAAAAIGAAIAGMLSIGLMAAVNFIIHSDFKWLLLGIALVWAASIARFVGETTVFAEGCGQGRRKTLTYINTGMVDPATMCPKGQP